MPNEFKIKNGFFSEGNSNITGSLNVSAGITGSLFGTASFATTTISSSFASTASFVNILNQNVLISGSLTVGTSSAGPSENTITLGARDTANEGGQIGFNAPGGTYTSASFIDNWQNKHRILKGNNTTSTGLIAQWDIHTTQLQLPAYTSVSSFPGTAAANLAVDSAGNIITVSTTGGSVFPYVGNAVITGSLTVTQPVYIPINGNMYLQGGDDAALYDINVSNHMGIYGVQDVTVGAIKLGSNGAVLYGSSSRFGINTTNPSSASLTVNGNVWATSFTGSLLGTASYATQALTASYAIQALSSSFATTASYAIQALSSSYALTASYAPNLVISGSINNVDYIDFNTGSATPAWKSGRVFWDNTDGALAVYNAEADITLQVGQENWTRVRNNTGTTITNGTAVRLDGSQGDVPTVVRAQSVQVSGSVNLLNQILGLATHDIENNSFGYITTQGLVRGLNTSAFNDGDALFVGTGSAGVLQNTSPRAPFEIIPIGVCVKASPGGSGIIYVAVQQPIDFSDLSSALVQGTYSYGDLWTYTPTGSSGVWRHTNQLSGSYGVTGSWSATSFTGSLLGTASYATQALSSSYALSASFATSTAAVAGTTNYVSKFTSGTTIGNSQIFDNGTNVGIGTTTPQAKFSVNGNTQITGSILSTGQITSRTNHGITINPITQNFGSYMSYVSSTGTLFVGIDDYLGSIFNNGADARNIYSSGNAPIVISTNSTASMAITSAGNVGIGTTSPLAKLDVVGSTRITGSLGVTGSFSTQINDNTFGYNVVLSNINGGSSALSGIALSNTSQQPAAIFQQNSNGDLGFFNSATTGKISFFTDSTTRMTIDEAGYVGIGTTSPYQKLDVNEGHITTYDSSAKEGKITFNNGFGGIRWDQLNSKLHLIANSADAVTVLASGNVGIGTTSPNAKLDVNGNTIITGSLTVTGGITGSITSASFAISSSRAISSSFALTASYVGPTLNQDLTLNGTLNVTNLNAVTSSIQYITSSQLDISTNIIKLNTTAPLRYGGIAVVDSGSSPQLSGSFLFDSQNNQWISIHQASAGSAITSSVVIMGPQTFNNVGNEITIGTNRLTKGSGGDLGEHITSSNITDTGTVVSINSATEITGSLRGQVSTLSITSNTASVNMATNNFFNLTLVDGANTHINPTNIQPGQTVNIRIRQGAAGTGTVSFPPFVDQASGSSYTGSMVSSAFDIVTMITFDTSVVYLSSIRNMV
jgi:hypothetical protein